MRALHVTALTAVLLTASALAISGCGTRVGPTTSENSYTITEPVMSLKIDNPVRNTQIEGTDTNTISVTEQLHYTGNPPQTSYPITAGRQLTLSYTCPGVFDVNSCRVTYVVKVPRRLTVQIDDKVGTTTLTGLAGQLTLTSSTGKHRRNRTHQPNCDPHVPMPARSPWDSPRHRPPSTHRPRLAQ